MIPSPTSAPSQATLPLLYEPSCVTKNTCHPQQALKGSVMLLSGARALALKQGEPGTLQLGSGPARCTTHLSHRLCRACIRLPMACQNKHNLLWKLRAPGTASATGLHQHEALQMSYPSP